MGHVGDLRPRRHGAVHHRLEHLRRGDHVDPGGERCRDDPLLEMGDVLERGLHPEVAPRDHHGIGRGQDPVEVLQSLRLLQLGDDRHALPRRPNRPDQPPDVLGRPDEGKRHVVDAEAESELQVVPVLPRQGRQRYFPVGQVDPLPVCHLPPLLDTAPHLTPGNRSDGEPHGPVLEEDPVPGTDVGGQPLVIDAADRLVAADVPGGQGEVGPLLQNDAPLPEAAQPDLGPLQVLQDRHVSPLPPGFLPHDLDGAGVRFMFAVREIEPRDGHPVPDQLRDDGRRIGRGADRAHDLGGGQLHGVSSTTEPGR